MTETFRVEARAALLRASKLNGIDEVEVRGETTLLVRFFHNAPAVLSPYHLRVRGGVAVHDIRVIDVQLLDSDNPDLPTLAEVSLDRRGDASIYELEVFDLEHIDPRYRSGPFSFFPDADADLDCAAEPPAPPNGIVAPPPIDYLAKDYGGFRQLMLDRLAVTMPGWGERHVPDIGVMLVEMLAYVADRLSYHQDAVATEAYLGTARRRVSVRRHVRLVDYWVHEGATARALVQINPPADVELALADASFASGHGADRLMFRPMRAGRANADLRAANCALQFHCWENRGCVLTRGSTSATLVDPDPNGRESLRAGDFLVFEVVDERFGGTPDADPALRHPVRLTRVRRSRDPLRDVPLIEIAWSSEDATPVDLPLDAANDDTIGRVAVARANIVLVDEGREVVEGDRANDALLLPAIGPGRRRTLALGTAGLGFAALIGARESARSVLSRQDPRAAAPMIERFTGWKLGEHGAPAGEPVQWQVRRDLIGSGPDDPHAVVEVDDEGAAVLRFGDGVCGRDPGGWGFEIAYRVSRGPSGNIGAESIAALTSTDQPDAAGWTVRNPIAASGAVAAEDLAQVRLLAPHAFLDTLVRAVDAQDYAALARTLDPDVQRATCSLVRSGLRLMARVAIDPRETDADAPAVVARVAERLAPYRHVGHELAVVQGKYVPLLLVLKVTVGKGFVRGHVREALLAVLGSSDDPAGRPGPFAPDSLGFGTPVYGSPLIAAAQAVPGVRNVAIVELARLFDRERGVYADGVLAMAWDEIPQLDNDPLRPDRGRLDLRIEGGLP